MPTVKFIVEA